MGARNRGWEEEIGVSWIRGGARHERIASSAWRERRPRGTMISPMLDPSEINPETPRPIARSEYDRMVEMGFFEGERVELLYGVIVRMSPHGPEHDGALNRLAEILTHALVGRARVRVQSGFAASDGSEPEPDIAVVPLADYDAEHPREAWLIVEVAKSSLAKDLGPKARLYAESGVDEYWVVDLVARRIVVYTGPENGRYLMRRDLARGEVVELRRFAEVSVAVADVLRT